MSATLAAAYPYFLTRRGRGLREGMEGEVPRGVGVGLGYGEHIGQCLVYIHVYLYI